MTDNERPTQNLGVLTRKVSELTVHAENDKIYGESRYDYLEKSIAEKGIYEPLLITKTNQIISGSRRWLVAKILKLTDVPVLVFPSDDELVNSVN